MSPIKTRVLLKKRKTAAIRKKSRVLSPHHIQKNSVASMPAIEIRVSIDDFILHLKIF